MKLKIEFLAPWLQAQKEKQRNPVFELAQFLRAQFSNAIVCEEKSLSILFVSFQESALSVDKFEDAIKRFMRKEYGVRNAGEVLVITNREEPKKESLKRTEDRPACDEEGVGDDLAVSEEFGGDEDLAGAFGGLDKFADLAKDGLDKESSFDGEVAKEGLAGGDESGKATAGESLGEKLSGAEGGKGGSSAIVEKIESLIGAEDFKQLCKELLSIAPIVKESGAIECVLNQVYLFSINDGYGLSTAVRLFSALLGETGLRQTDINSCLEIKIPYKADGDKDPFEPIRPSLDQLIRDLVSHRQNAVVCFDISEWMTNINNRSLRAFIRDYYKHSSVITLIFRIPFVNEEIFARVKESLEDMAFIRGVKFPMLTREELRERASMRLARYGFEIAGDAWEKFDEKIFQEKKDGRFYGFSTIDKVTSELLYKKHVTCANGDKSSKVISLEDVDAVCSHVTNKEYGMETLNDMVGGDKIRARIEEIIAQIETSRLTDSGAPCIHMRFIGNPGTGKTTVARIIGKVLKEKGVLRLGGFFEYSGRDFCGRYIGETAPKTAAMCRDAYGSILFIDEAYSLYRGDDNDKDYGREALDTLIAEMENNRSDLLVIMAGYPKEMEKLMEGNQGLASRMPYVLEFPNFNREELITIFKKMVKPPYTAGEGLFEKVEEYFKALPQSFLDSKQFSNARFVRNLYERTIAKTAMRKRAVKGQLLVIEKEDFELASGDKEFKSLENKSRKIGFR